MGRSLVKSALRHGDKVCAVGKTLDDSMALMQGWYDDPDHYLGTLCDVRIRESVQSVFDKALAKFGDVDIIANCSGYGVIGACEDQDEYEIRNQFETNFMGTLNTIQTSLPYFREKENGRYLIFSSTSGALGVPGLGPYCATKYAIEGLVESMLYEVDGFGIKLTLVEPGHMRRDDKHTQANGQKLPKFGHFKVMKPSEHYEAKDSPAAHAQRMLQWIGDNQPTSAVKAAELVWQLGHCSYPPLRLLLGTFAVDSIRDRLKSIIEEIEDWKHLHFPPIEGQEPEPDDQGNENEDENEQDMSEATDDNKRHSHKRKEGNESRDVKMEED